MLNRLKTILLIFCLAAFGGAPQCLARENPLPAFRITGYIEKINADSIKIFVPRMKQSMALLLAKEIKITDFSETGSSRQYTLKDLQEKDMAVCEGVITVKGFVCSAIAFVHQANIVP
jgi:hypothetical protein